MRMKSLFDEGKKRSAEANKETERMKIHCDDLPKLCQELKTKLASANEAAKLFDDLSRVMNNKK